MADQANSTTFRENYRVLKETADWLAKPGEADIDQLVPKVEAAMTAYSACKERLDTVRAKLNQYFKDEPGVPTDDRTDKAPEDDEAF